MIEKDKKSMKNVWEEMARTRNWDRKGGWRNRQNSLEEKWDKQSFYQGGDKEILGSAIPFLKEKGLKETDFKKMRVLDLGCGAGRITAALAKRFKFADGIDISEEAIKIAKEEHSDIKNLKFYLGNGIDLQVFPDNFFDFVFSYIVFQHIPKKSIIINYLREIHRVLKEKSYFKVQVRGYPAYLLLGIVPWWYKGFNSFYIALSKKKKIPFPVIHKYNPIYGAFFKEKEIKKIIQNIGFSEIETFYSPPGSHYLWVSSKKCKENKIPVIMLMGAGRSGSTLMDLIFDSHSQIKGVGEFARFQNRIDGNRKEQGICGCGKKIKECEFWQRAFHDIDYNKLRSFCERGIDFLLKRNYFYARGKEKFDITNYIESTEKVYRNILAYSGKKIIFDSSKSPVRAEVLLQNPNLEIIFLHLVRDGRGVVYSNMKRGRRPFYFMKRWMINNIKTEIVKTRNRKVKNIFIYYDDFAKNPEKIVKYILKEIDLHFEPGMLNFRKQVHHLSPGNYSLLFLKKSDKIKRDLEWKKKMPVKAKILFNILFGWLNIFYKLKPKKY